MERSNGDLKVVVLTAGTTKKGECSYFLNNDSVDECTWGLCDGHAESVCYRLASFYLITEMHRYNKNRETSILEIQYGGFALKEGIKFHFFTTQPPCGFMAKEERHFLSWKIPFKGKPHCLQCSSTILIGAYLGIQGPLSHLFSKPVYISSVTILKHKDVTVEKGIYIKKCFEKFQARLDDSTDDNTNCGYEFHIPHVEITDCESSGLFQKCFKQYNDESACSETIERHNENQTPQTAATVPDAEGSLGSYLLAFTLKSGIGANEFRKKITLQLKNAAEKAFANEPPQWIKVSKEQKLEMLKEARLRLCRAMNVQEALKQLQNVINKKIEERFTTHHQNNDKVVVQLKEKCQSITDQLTVQVNELGATMKQCKSEHSIERLTSESLSASTKKFNDDSKSIVCSLNESIEEIQSNTNSAVDVLTDYYDYQETLYDLNELLKKSEGNSCGPQFYLDLMGCDWARYMKSILKDITK